MNLQDLYITTEELAKAFRKAVKRRKDPFNLLYNTEEKRWYVVPHFGAPDNWQTGARNLLSHTFDVLYPA